MCLLDFYDRMDYPSHIGPIVTAGLGKYISCEMEGQKEKDI